MPPPPRSRAPPGRCDAGFPPAHRRGLSFFAATTNCSLPQAVDAGVVPPFAGGFTGHTNDGNDTKTDEMRAMTSETRRQMESAGAEVLNLTEALARMGAARGGACS